MRSCYAPSCILLSRHAAKTREKTSAEIVNLMQPREDIGSRCGAAMQGLGPDCPPAGNLTLTVFPAVVNLPLPPKTGAGFWRPRVGWAEGEFPAHLPSPGKAKNARRAMTAQRSGLAVAGISGAGRRRGVCGPPKAPKCRAWDPAVSGMAPPSRMSFPHHPRGTPADRGEL